MQLCDKSVCPQKTGTQLCIKMDIPDGRVITGHYNYHLAAPVLVS